MNAKKTNLMELCERGTRDWVELEIENGAKVNKKDKDGFTALHFACMYGYKDIVELLIEKGAEIKRIEPDSIRNPLMLACENGHKDVVELLIQCGFDIASDKITEPNSLHIACLKGYRSIAELLLRVGYQFDNSNNREHKYSKEKLFLEACSNGHLEIVKLLIEMKTNVVINSDKDSSLYKAIENGHTQIVELLLDNQVKKEIKQERVIYFTELANHAIRDIYIFLRNMVITNFYESFDCLDLYKFSPSSLWEWTFNRKFYKLLILVRDFRWTLTTIVKNDDFYVGYDELRNAKILSYFQSDNFINKLKFKLEHLKLLSEKIKLNISQIKNKITDFREVKHYFDRNFTELEKNEMISHEHLMEFINLIQDEQIRETFLKNLDSWLRDQKSNSTNLADEFHQIYDLVSSEKLSAFLRSEKAIDEVPNEIRTANSYQRIYEKRSPLVVACENNNMSLVQRLILRGEDINVRDVDGKTPLMKACFMKHFELAQMLIQLGADIQIEDENGENAAFFIKTTKGIEKGDLAYQVFTNLLNTKKTDVNKANRFGETLLLYASYYGQLDIIDFLFDNGVDSKICTKFIQKLILYEASVVFSYLFVKGAQILDFNDLDVPYTYSYTPYDSPLGHAFELDCEGEIIPLFYEKGYLQNVSIDRLLLMASSKNFKLIKYFVEKGANVNHYDEDGNSALIILAKSAMEDILEPVKYLVDHGADINHFNNSGISVLYYACEPDQKSTCAFLIEKGASFYQNGASIFLEIDAPCQYLFCSGLIRNFYKLFQSHEASVLKEKIFKSIETKEIGIIDSLRAFKMIYEEEDQVTNAKELRNDKILEYFASFDFREKFVTDVLINLKDKLELLNIGKKKIKLHFPDIKMPSIEKFNLPIINIVNNKEIISADIFMEKLREHKKQNEMEFKSLNLQLGKFNEETLSFSELVEWLLGDNLIKIINQESDFCAKINKAFILCKIINFYSLELERILNVSNKLFDFLSQEEVRSFLNLK